MPVNKDPITDPGKASKAGRQMLYLDNGKYVTGLDTDPWADKKIEALECVYDSGVVWQQAKLADIRERAMTVLDSQVWKGF